VSSSINFVRLVVRITLSSATPTSVSRLPRLVLHFRYSTLWPNQEGAAYNTNPPFVPLHLHPIGSILGLLLRIIGHLPALPTPIQVV
jgi:hypothetical protein